MYLLFVILFCIFIYWIYHTNTNIDISYFEIKNDKIPNNFNDFKIVQVSDLQNNNWNGRIEKLIEIENPDAVFITGDFLDCYNTNFEVAKNFIENLKGFKIFYVNGNHEARIEKYQDFENYLKDKGVVVLNNEVFELYRKDSKVNILGITDPAFTPNKEQNKTAENSIKSLKYDKDFNILLSHRPEHFNIYTKHKINLVFCGHAHGGQIIIPFIKRGLIAPNQKIFPKYTNGIYVKENTTMVVSRGLGNSRFKYRINNKPNMIVVILKKTS